MVYTMKSNLLTRILILSLLTNTSAMHFPTKVWGDDDEGLLRDFSEHSQGIKLSTLTVKEHIIGGSGGVYVLEDPIGTRFTLKYLPNHPNQMKEEILTDAWYQALGIAVPEFAIYDTLPEPLAEQLGCDPNGIFRLSRFIERKQATDEEIAEHLSRNFVADAIFANWDIPVSFKNVIMGKDGILYRIDNGGALRFRALGELKINTPDWNPSKLVELESLRKNSPEGRFAYGKLTEEDINKQMKTVLEKSHALFPTLWKLHQILKFEQVEDIQKMLTYRLQDLRLRLGATPTQNGNDSIVTAESAGGALSITNINNEPHVLIGQRIKHKWWGNLGGKSDIVDGTVAQTASREVGEESANLIYLSPHRLRSSPSHTLHIDESFYRMYMIETPFVEAETLKHAIGLDPMREYSNIRWVPLKALLRAIEEGEKVIEEGQETTAISFEDENLTLHPPFYQMLQQEAVRQILYAWEVEKKQPIIPYHSASIAQKIVGHCHLPQPPRLTKRKIVWPQVDTEQNLFADNDRVPFGANANGQGVLKRILTEGENQTEDLVILDPHLEEEKARKALINHTLMIRGFKKFITVRLRKEITKKVHVKLFNVLQKLDKEEEEKENKIPTEQSSDLEKLTCTASEAHLKEVLGSEYDENNMDANILNILQKKGKDSSIAEKELTLDRKILAREKEHFESYVFYHGCLGAYGFVWDILTQIRNMFFLTNHEETRTLRAFENVFKGINDIKSFILQMIHLEEDFNKDNLDKENTSKGKINNYSEGYQARGLSVNISYYGNYKCITSDSNHYFRSGKSFKPPVGAFELLESFLTELKIVNLQAILKQFEALYKKRYPNGVPGRLLQIFMKPAAAKQIGYLSGHVGKVILLKGDKVYTPISHALSPIRQNKELAFDSTSYCINDLQTRLLLDPETMHGDGVKIISYHNDETSPEDVVPHIQKIVHDMLFSSSSFDLAPVYEGYSPIVPQEFLHKQIIGQRIHKKTSHYMLSKLADQGYLSPDLLTFMAEHSAILDESIVNHLTLRKQAVLESQTLQGSCNIALALFFNNLPEKKDLDAPEEKEFIIKIKHFIVKLQEKINLNMFRHNLNAKNMLGLISIFGAERSKQFFLNQMTNLLDQMTYLTFHNIESILSLLQDGLQKEDLIQLAEKITSHRKKSGDFIATLLTYCKTPEARNRIQIALPLIEQMDSVSEEEINQLLAFLEEEPSRQNLIEPTMNLFKRMGYVSGDNVIPLLITIEKGKVTPNNISFLAEQLIKQGMPSFDIKMIIESLGIIPPDKQQQYIKNTAIWINKEMDGPDIAKILAAMEKLEDVAKDPAFIENSEQLNQIVENHRASEGLIGLKDAKQSLEDLKKFKTVISEVQELLQWPELGVPLYESSSFDYQEAFKDTRNLNDFVETLKNLKKNGVDVSEFLINFSSVCNREKNMWNF